jgi:hypothetical protein
LAKPNYQFERRQRDLAKRRKQEEKRQRKLAGKAAADDGVPAEPAPEQPVTGDSPPGAAPKPEG